MSVRIAIRAALVVFGAAVGAAACGSGQARYVQMQPPTVCEAGTQPAIVDLPRGYPGTGTVVVGATVAQVTTPAWSCLPECRSGQEYVTTVSMANRTILPRCKPACQPGWRRETYLYIATGNLPDVCGPIQAECMPVSDEAKAEYEQRHKDCQGGRQIVRAKNECRALCRGTHQDCEASCRRRFGESQLNNPPCWIECNAAFRQCAAGCP